MSRDIGAFGPLLTYYVELSRDSKKTLLAKLNALGTEVDRTELNSWIRGHCLPESVKDVVCLAKVLNLTDEQTEALTDVYNIERELLSLLPPCTANLPP